MTQKQITKCLFIFIFFIAYANNCFSQNDSTINNTFSEFIIVKNIILIGNEKTKKHIIYRELIFHLNDTLQRDVFEAAAKRTRENLLNTFLFNFVEIDYVTDNNSHTFVTIQLAERWYLWPIPIFELVDRNFNEWWQTKDFSRTNFGINLTQQNFRGRNETMALITRFGFDQNFGLVYTVPYLNKKQNDGFRFGINYFQSKETSYNVVDNKLLFLRTNDAYVFRQFYSGGRFSHRIGHNKELSASFEYRNTKVRDTLIALNNDYLQTNTNKQELMVLSLRYQIDTRDSKSYPLNGDRASINLVKQGFGALKNEPNHSYIFVTYKHYEKLNERFNLSGSVVAKLSDGNKFSYYNSRALGYENYFVRGYELYVINGQHFSLFKTNIKYALVKPKVFTLNWVPSKKFNKIPIAFYINAYSDFAYVDDNFYAEINPLANKWINGYGVGIDFVTYYDLITRFDYSINKFGEKAFFIHFRAPI